MPSFTESRAEAAKSDQANLLMRSKLSDRTPSNAKSKGPSRAFWRIAMEVPSQASVNAEAQQCTYHVI